LDYALQYSSHHAEFYVIQSRLLLQEEDYKEANKRWTGIESLSRHRTAADENQIPLN
jgi:hypothetical protein